MVSTSSSDEGKKAVPSTFTFSIASFKAIWFSILVGLAVLIGSQELRNIANMEEKAEEIRKNRLPELIENQKTLANIESLRRLAEVTNISGNPRERRNARISADALATESIFDRDPSFRSSARKIAASIRNLDAVKQEIDKKKLTLGEVEARYRGAVVCLARMTAAPEDLGTLMEINARGLHFPPSGTAVSRVELQARAEGPIREVQAILDRFPSGGLTKEVAAHFDVFRAAASEWVSVAQELLMLQQQAQNTWAGIDEDLRVIRDTVTTGSETAVTTALQSIKESSSRSLRTAIVLYLLILLFVAGYYVLAQLLIVKPLRWTSQKLSAIQEGKLDTRLPRIHIKEIAHVADLLNRFTGHLAELYRHADQLEEDAAAKRNLEEIMRAVFKVSLDGYVVWNASRVITVSSGAMNLLELSREDEITAQLEVSTTLAERAQSVSRRLQDAAAWREEVVLSTRSNTALPCEMTHVAMRFDNEQCILTYIRDLREQKRHEMALLTAKEQAEVATRAKSEFLARMSHEIRTPMNGVIGLTQMALATAPSPKQRELLEKIQASAQILLGIINDILDFSKIEQGKIELESRPFSLTGVFRTISDLLTPQAVNKNITFEQRIDTAMFAETLLKGDALRLSQVLLNLCGNAVKFTETGGVVLSATCLDKTTEAVSLRFSVKDTGIGLSEDQLPLLFQPFTQADSSTTRKYGGTGLGLMISRLLVEQMGGAISVVSEPGVGSEFSFTLRLPISRESAGDPLGPAKADAEPTASFAGKRILVAEDNEVNQLVIVAFLESLGIAVTLAGNGQEAVDLVGSLDFDCIFMDIQMPVMDGLTATRAIRAHERQELRGVPIIAMTAHAMPDDVQKSLEAGMNAHVTKPIDREQLVRLLQQVLSR